MDMKEILTYERKKRNISQKKISEILNITRSAYTKYETGKNTPSIETILQLANLYGCSTDYLLGRYKEN